MERGSGASFSVDTQNPPGHNPVQHALGESALAAWAGPTILRNLFQSQPKSSHNSVFYSL